ncbi:Methylamine utilization protein MauG [Nymphon striatum]|nr:Methylamine utilization protein MauG [Nymphon striatum]
MKFPLISQLFSKRALLIFILASFFSGCDNTDPHDAELQRIISHNTLTGTPTSHHKIPNINSPKAQLGMKLFYTKTLGGDRTTACVTCHHPLLGGGDNLSLSVGTNSSNPSILGRHREIKFDGHVEVPRNAPTTFNVAFYKKVLFHDGRVERLGKHSIHTPDVAYPNEDPLAGETLQLQNMNARRFLSIIPGKDISKVISQHFLKKPKKDALLFYKPHDQGGANCVSCHSGDFFTNEKAYNTAIPQIGNGKDNGVTKSNDYGCNLVTGKSKDKFRFRTPSLLNVEVTGPWGHDGAYTSLEGITKHMLSPKESARNYNPMQLKQKHIAINDLESNTQEALDAGVHLLPKPDLKKEDVTNLVKFLKALTDPCVKDRACLSKWIPKPEDNDPDDMMLHAINGETGNFL